MLENVMKRLGETDVMKLGVLTQRLGMRTLMNSERPRSKRKNP